MQAAEAAGIGGLPRVGVLRALVGRRREEEGQKIRVHVVHRFLQNKLAKLKPDAEHLVAISHHDY